MTVPADALPADVATFDYVVVGSGAGGGPVAANLAEAGHRVLLLEAGLDPEDDDYRVPAFHGRASEHPGMSWPFYVRHFDDRAQQERDEKFVPEQDGVLYPRSGTLGGCTAHNAMITVYPHDADWDAIAAATGDRSWRATEMRQWFERLEACQYKRRPRMLPRHPWLARLLAWLPFVSDKYVNRSRHGFDGWLHTTLADPALALGDRQVISVIKSAAARSLADFLHRPLTPFEGLASAVDPNDWRGRTLPEGLWLIPLAVRKGRRNGSRERIRDVEGRRPGGLEVRTGTLVTRVLFDEPATPDGDPVAVGVEYLAQPHAYGADPEEAPAAAETVRVRARREVVLAAGAFNTPQLLKLSGIGPRAELDRFGIPCRRDLPGVGENLQDRYEVGVVTRMRRNFALLDGLTFKPPGTGEDPDAGYLQWQDGEGVYTTNGALLGIIRRSRPELTSPDLFIFGLPARFTGYFPGYSGGLAQATDVFTWAILKAHTVNRGGSVLLRSADPRDTPDVRFRYFEEGTDTAGEDLDAVVTGIEVARSIMACLEDDVAAELVPGPTVESREELRSFVRDQAWGHHASCTAAMGPATDPGAVVGSDFRVHGTQGLRVVDASVFPRIPGFFIVTAIYMAAEKASAVILADAARQEPAAAPSRPDLRHVLARLPHPRKPTRSAVIRPSEVQEIR
ncbi:GMC oxidoreductase [Blastococcus sp. CT_GayMR16]|uniref:GMC family oxidoreductase n=1 Tax=Blastococcus sp. CT_GayMR16 TaxID=2559607 RepID=UPI001ADD7DDA|nr:GMC oxidoreductase [Blastococcus sp. CT_GayMR16]